MFKAISSLSSSTMNTYVDTRYDDSIITNDNNETNVNDNDHDNNNNNNGNGNDNDNDSLYDRYNTKNDHIDTKMSHDTAKMDDSDTETDNARTDNIYTNNVRTDNARTDNVHTDSERTDGISTDNLETNSGSTKKDINTESYKNDIKRSHITAKMDDVDTKTNDIISNIEDGSTDISKIVMNVIDIIDYVTDDPIYQAKEVFNEVEKEGVKEGEKEVEKEGVKEGEKEGVKEGVKEVEKEGVKEGVKEGELVVNKVEVDMLKTGIPDTAHPDTDILNTGVLNTNIPDTNVLDINTLKNDIMNTDILDANVTSKLAILLTESNDDNDDSQPYIKPLKQPRTSSKAQRPSSAKIVDEIIMDTFINRTSTAKSSKNIDYNDDKADSPSSVCPTPIQPIQPRTSSKAQRPSSAKIVDEIIMDTFINRTSTAKSSKNIDYNSDKADSPSSVCPTPIRGSVSLKEGEKEVDNESEKNVIDIDKRIDLTTELDYMDSMKVDGENDVFEISGIEKEKDAIIKRKEIELKELELKKKKK
jgi:hypothetical protein